MAEAAWFPRTQASGSPGPAASLISIRREERRERCSRRRDSPALGGAWLFISSGGGENRRWEFCLGLSFALLLPSLEREAGAAADLTVLAFLLVAFF